MRKNRYPVIDSDGHIMERPAELFDVVAGASPDRRRDLAWKESFGLFPSLDGWARGSHSSSRGRRDFPDAEEWVAFLDECGIEATVVFPTAGLSFGLVTDVPWAIELAATYNTWLADRYLAHSPRINGVAMVPVQDVPAACEEVRRAVVDLGMRAVFLPSVNSLHRGYGHEAFFPLYETCCELDVPLVVHGAPSRGLGFDHLDSFMEVHTLEHPIPLMIQLTTMVCQGVFEMFPDLRVAYCEAGAGWLPFMMDRLDEEFERRGDLHAPRLQRPPSDYIRAGGVHVTIESEERTLPAVIEIFGDRGVMFASDFPHERSHHEFACDIPDFENRADISEDSKRRILAENARAFYRLP